jgi:hypothetical protein
MKTPLRLFRALFPFGLGCMALSMAVPVEGGAGLPRIVVNKGGHYLQTEDGKPFLWIGDTGWKLIQSTTPAECSYYLNTRARQGFTVIQTMVLAENESVTVPNKLGQLAFIDQDPKKPNHAFFDHVVSVVDEAASLGLYVALVPSWGDKLTAPWGTGPRIFRNDNLGDARAYGKYLGERLKGRTNVMFVIGGDRPAKLKGLDNDFLQRLAKDSGFPADQDWTPIWTAMSDGLQDGFGSDPVCLYHPQGGPFSSSQQVPEVPWIDIHGMQSGHGGGHDSPVWEWMMRDFAMTPAKPSMDIEPNYEDHPYNPWPRWDASTGWFRDHDVRKQCYRGIFAGGAGVTYGHHAVWQFAGLRNDVINFADRDWIDALHRPGARQLIHLRNLIESRPFFTRVPDMGLIVTQPGRDGANICVATRDEAGTYALVYVPNIDLTVTVDLRKLRSSKVKAWWYDTRTGFSHPIGEFENGGTRDFKSPSFGPDWVLMLEDPAANYPRPGLQR